MSTGISIVNTDRVDALRLQGATFVDARSVRQRGVQVWSGGVRIPWTDTRTGGHRSGLLPGAAVLARMFEQRGVDWDRPVVVVGAGASGWGEGARVAWSLAWLDHPNVSWLPVFGRAPKLPRVPKSVARRGWTGATCGQIRAPGGVEIPPGSVVVDVRSRVEQSGTCKYGEARGGHIPGARFLPLSRLWSTAGFTAHKHVRDLAVAADIPLDAPLVCVCTGGVRSAAAALMLEAAGVGETVRNHDGGMWAWSADSERPMQRRSLHPSSPS